MITTVQVYIALLPYMYM